jgi:hypothetical protein
MEDLFEKINNLYNNTGYIARYGSDIWLTVIILIIFFISTTYFYILNHIEPILADWDNQKCNPSVIPFAGLINKKSGMSAFDYTGSNFTGCIQTILTGITADAFKPIYYLMKTFTDEFQSLSNALNSVRAVFNKIRISVEDVSTDIMSRTLNVTMPLVQFMLDIKSLIGKVIGTLTASLYTLFGSYLAMKSLFLFIMHLIIVILISLAASIAALLIISFIPLIGIPAGIAVVPLIAIMIAILIPTIIVKLAMKDVMSLQTESTPSVPGCFSKNTKILVKNEDKQLIYVNISDVEVGDELIYNAKVTGVIKFSAQDQHIYNLYDVLVTGEHRVFYENLGWIKVKNHPHSFHIRDFTEPYVYCLLTSNKIFKINEIIYSDWDDIDEKVLLDLALNSVSKNHIPKYFKNTDIHIYLDNGLQGDTLILLADGHSSKKLKHIEVGEMLHEGVKVLGIVKIDALKLENGVNKYYLDNEQTICCSTNIHISNDSLGEMNTFDLIDYTPVSGRETFLYQLITDTGYFFLEKDLKVRDYNYGIDKYLS